MSYLLFDALFLGLPVAFLLRRAGRPPSRLLRACAVLAATALIWTAPWDEYLVRSDVWSYGGDRVLARLGEVPLEEYAFVVLEVLLVAAWGHLLGRFSTTAVPTGHRRRGAACWLVLLAVGVALLVAGGPLRYLGLLLLWAAPPLALQRAVAGDLLRPRLNDRLVLALPVALWLCVADRLALADGIWTISPNSSTGLLLLGLPVEEALFFLLTSLLVADGLVLATDPRALARLSRLLTRRPVLTQPGPASDATRRRSAPRSAPAESLRARTSA